MKRRAGRQTVSIDFGGMIDALEELVDRLRCLVPEEQRHQRKFVTLSSATRYAVDRLLQEAHWASDLGMLLDGVLRNAPYANRKRLF